MDHVIGGADLQGTVEESIDTAMGKAAITDRIVLSYGAAKALLDEIDELRNENEPARPRFLHVVSVEAEQLIRVEAISCAVVQKDGSAAVVFAGGGVIPFDALAWRMVFSHIKNYSELELVPVAPSSKLVSQA